MEMLKHTAQEKSNYLTSIRWLPVKFIYSWLASDKNKSVLCLDTTDFLNAKEYNN